MTDLNPEGLEKAAEELNEAGWTCDGGSHEPMGINACPECREVCTDLARAAVTAYLDHAHPVVDGVAGVALLPNGSIIMDADGDIFQRSGKTDYSANWYTIGQEDECMASQIPLPARVIHRGTP